MDSSTASVPGWNSASYIDIVVSIETEFGLELSTLEAARMYSIRGIYEVLFARGIKLSP